MSRRDVVILAALLVALFLLTRKKLEEKVTGRLILPQYENCGVAPSILFPPQEIKWCIDPTTELEFPFELTTARAMIFGLSDPVLAQRSLQLNRG